MISTQFDAFSRAYIRTPCPDREILAQGVNILESELSTATPNYAQLNQMVNQLTDTMGFRAASGDVCDQFLAETGEQLRHILKLVGEGETEKSFPILRELIRGAYSASVHTRVVADQTTYERLSKCHGAKNAQDASFTEFRDILDLIVNECKAIART